MVELPRRKKIRLQGYDYSQNGAYFVTICTQNRRALFWSAAGADAIRRGEAPVLSKYGMIVDEAIKNISKFYPHVSVDKYCIMPDHIHMIVLISSGRIISAPTTPTSAPKTAPTLSTIIGQMKRYVSKQISFPMWQKSFYDRIIKDEKAYHAVWHYIDTNPIKWCQARQG